MRITSNNKKFANPMILPVAESQPPAKATPLDAETCHRAAVLPAAASGAKLKNSQRSRSDALPFATGDRELSKLRSTISFREALDKNASCRSHGVGSSASLAAEAGAADVELSATATRRALAPDATGKAGGTLSAAREAELQRIAAKERELAALEKLPTAWRAEDALAWRALRAKPAYAARFVSGAPTTAASDARLSLDAMQAKQRERASLDDQVGRLVESKFVCRELSAVYEPAARSVGAPATAKSDAPSSLDEMLAKPIEKKTISPANGLWQVCARQHRRRVCPRLSTSRAASGAHLRTRAHPLFMRSRRARAYSGAATARHVPRRARKGRRRLRLLPIALRRPDPRGSGVGVR